MMYITGIGDEVSNFVIILLIFCVVYFGWRSTNVRENTAPVGVFIIEQNSRTTIATREVQRSDSQSSNRTETEELTVNNVIEELENDISDFISSNSNTISEQATSTAVTTREVNGEEEIIETMDRSDANESATNKTSDSELRHRKVTGDDEESISKDNERELTIKLKYLNDELKLVTTKPSEAIGDFKRRNFSVELSAQKLVRLVFNGHVLQPDKKTVEECGLFDQCVVHCLIHNKKPDHSNPASNPEQGQTTNNETGEVTTGSRIDESESFLNRPEHGRWYLYIGMVLITITLIFCWFCRINYSYLFTFYSTIGLVLMSVLFFAMIPLILLVERDVVN